MPFSDPDKRRSYGREYARKTYEANRERVLQRGREWSARNREYARAKSASLRLLKAGKITREQHAALLRRPDGPPPRRNEYGLTSAAYQAMLEQQRGVCALCGMVNRDGIKLHIDHEHVEGYEKLSLEERARLVRGLLCKICNMFLGFCGDDPQIAFARATALAANVRSYLTR